MHNWANPIADPRLPPPSGRFAAERKHDIHTGLDLHCAASTPVFAMSDGIVVDAGRFTGPAAGSPWWLDTDFVTVRHADLFVVYGEIVPTVVVGDVVLAGQQIGVVSRVLRYDKGAPTAMLHIETYSEYTEPVTWRLGSALPAGLRDPEIELVARGLHIQGQT